MLHVQESAPCKTDPYMDQYDPADKGKPFVSLLFDIALPNAYMRNTLKQ